VVPLRLQTANSTRKTRNPIRLPAICARLGHAGCNITARIYSHALPADDNRAVDAWEKERDALLNFSAEAHHVNSL
jgi:hypothetical protein